MAEPRELIERVEREAALPAGEGGRLAERFSGYGVMACPFSSGDILCHRRFPASSVGPSYTSIWHRDPQGVWTFYQDVEPMQACTRFFGSEVARIEHAQIVMDWLDDRTLRISIPGVLEWEMSLASTLMTRAMNGMGSLMPDALWRNSAVLKVMAGVGGMALDAGKMALSGTAPNGQRFVANPLLIWTIRSARATLRGRDFGALTTSREQVKLGDFWIPRRGLLAIGRAFFEAFDPDQHLAATSGGRETD
jgi:hypothetical protein